MFVIVVERSDDESFNGYCLTQVATAAPHKRLVRIFPSSKVERCSFRNEFFSSDVTKYNRNMKKIYQTLAIAASLTLVSCNESRRGNDSNLNEDRNEAAAESNTEKFQGKKQRDADFVYEVVGSSYGEIKLAELANQRSRTPEVKQIAQQLLTDHTASLNELKTLAQAKAISIPVEEPDASKRKLENMAEEEGSEFDKEWVQEMIDLHKNDIDKFEDRLENTEDPELKAFIDKTLPALKKHHEHLERLEEEG